MWQEWRAIGNFGSNPEMRTAGNSKVVNFRFAVNKSWTGNDGERHEKTTWFKITAWGKLADLIEKYCKSGDTALLMGEIDESRAYINKAGEPASTNEVTLQGIKFLGGKKEGRTYNAEEHPGVALPELRDEDIPFA